MSTITFRALQLANEHRNAYGLRYNDHARYRKHCANRTHRLRSTLKMTHGKGKEFKKLPQISLENITPGHLQLLLFEAERAWSYAQDLIAQSLKSDSPHTLRHSATGRFRRSVHWATQLLSQCQLLHSSSRLSPENLAEVTVYVLILNGRFLRHRDDFEGALPQLCVARVMLDQLALSAQTSRDQALASLFSDEIAPEIRYCAHELGHPNSYDVDTIAKNFAAKHQSALVENYDGLISRIKASFGSPSGKKLKEVIWEGKPVPVRNPELVDALLKVQDAEARLTDGEKKAVAGSKKEVALFDTVLSSLSEAEETARKLSEAQSSSGATTSAPGVRDIHFVHAFVLYQLLARRTQRDMLLISSLLSSQKRSRSTQKQNTTMDARIYPALIKLFDSVLQNLEQIRTLSIVDDSPDLASAIDGRITFTKAQKCFYLSRSYAQVKKYAEALSLTQRAIIYLRETRSILSILTEDPVSSSHLAFYDLSNTLLDETDQQLTEHLSISKRDWFAYNGGSTGDNQGYKKPLFFNIALNYAECDMDRLLERAGKAPAKPAAPAIVAPVPEKKTVVSKVVDVPSRPATPEPQPAPARGGLSSLLGGWWGKN